MNPKTMKTLLLAILVLPGLAFAADGMFDETVALDSPIVLDVDTGSGGMSLETWPRSGDGIRQEPWSTGRLERHGGPG